MFEHLHPFKMQSQFSLDVLIFVGHYVKNNIGSWWANHPLKFQTSTCIFYPTMSSCLIFNVRIVFWTLSLAGCLVLVFTAIVYLCMVTGFADICNNFWNCNNIIVRTFWPTLESRRTCSKRNIFFHDLLNFKF